MNKIMLFRAGTTIHPSKRTSSGFCVNNLRTTEGKNVVVFASEVVKNSNSDRFEKNYYTDYIAPGVGLFLHKIPGDKGYLVAVNTPTCVTMLLADNTGYGEKACRGWAEDPRRVETDEIDHCGNDVVVMEDFQTAIESMDEVVVEDLKETIRVELMQHIEEALTMDRDTLVNKEMFSNKHEIINDVKNMLS